MKRIKSLKKSVFWGIFGLVTLITVFAGQRAVPFMMDDVWYRTLLYSDKPLSSLTDILNAQIWHYLNWGGRTIGHTILQVLLCMGELPADILNTVAVFVLAVLCGGVAGKWNLPYVCMAVGLLHGLNANWQMSMYWQAGACNYLYMTIFILAYLICYLRELEDEPPKALGGISFFILPLGLLAGWSNENMGPTLWLISLGVILWKRRQKRAVKAWMIEGSAAVLAGSLLVILAPGNFVRSQEVASNQYGLLWNCFLRGYYEATAALDYLFPVLLLTGMLVLFNVFFLHVRLNRKEIALLTAALLSWGAMVLSPHYPDRATFGTMVLLICVTLSLVKRMLSCKEDRRTVNAAVAMGCFIWLRGMYFIGKYIAVCWGWIR